MKKLSSNHFDVIIIGRSYAGLSAAMALGRLPRKVLILDSGSPCNAQIPHSHNFITQDGKKPTEISTIALEQVLKTVKCIKEQAIETKKTGSGFDIRTESEVFSAKKIILATGIRDIFPEISGSKIIHHGGKISEIILSNGKSVPMDALYTSLPFQQHSDIAGQLDCELAGTGHIRVDSFQKTNIDGVSACGDNASPMRSVADAVHTGSIAGVMVNHELLQEAF